MIDTFKEIFDLYMKIVVPNDASPTQVRETKLAFLAGAYGVASTIVSHARNDGATDEEAGRMVVEFRDWLTGEANKVNEET